MRTLNAIVTVLALMLIPTIANHNGGVWKVFVKRGGRLHRIGTAGCIGIQGSAEALVKLGSFLYDYIKTQNKNIQINFIITGNPNYGNNGKANPNLGQ